MLLKPTLLLILLPFLVGFTTLGELQAGPPSTQPNFVIILADDLGYSDLGCQGGEIQTPNLDRLAARGLRFSQFYNTARCWPTRSCIMTGYYPQQIGMDPQPQAKQSQRFKNWTQLLPQRLQAQGYHSYHSGKWHISKAPQPVRDAGFRRSFVLHDHDRFFTPQNMELDGQPLPPVPVEKPKYVTVDIADRSIEFLKQHHQDHADAPFLLYLCFTGPHFPLHAMTEDIDKYREVYKQGWDSVRTQRQQRIKSLGLLDCALSSPIPEGRAPWSMPQAKLESEIHPGELGEYRPWDQLNAVQQDYQATKMAVHAAMVDRMDQEIGRVVAQLAATQSLDNTVILFLSDNGASAEQINRGDKHDPAAPLGSGGSYMCLGPGWATAANAPFRLHKHWVHEGGVATPLIVSWPAGITDHGAIRKQAVGHCIDIVPTLLDLAGVPHPTTPDGAPPLPGLSLVPAFTTDVPTPRDQIFFHHTGNRGLRVGDWKLVSSKVFQDRWELYDLQADRSETTDLATKHPDRVAQMATRWQVLEDQYRKQAED